jgi:hypothetical protein
MSVAFRETRDEVHGYVWERFGVNGRQNAKDGGFSAMSEVFVLLTGGASFDVFCDPWPGSRPEVFFVNTPDCFISSGVTVQGSFMPCVHDFALQTLIWWDYESSSWNIAPEWFAWVVYTFNGESAFPFFHEAVVVVLDDGNEVFQRAFGVCVSYTDEYRFGEHDHLLIIVFAYVGPWRSGESICGCVVLSGYMMEGEVIVLKFSVPSGCALI